MTDSRPQMPSQEPEGFEIIDGIEYNTTPSRSLQKLSLEDRELWLAMAADMEQEIRARRAGHSLDT